MGVSAQSKPRSRDEVSTHNRHGVVAPSQELWQQQQLLESHICSLLASNSMFPQAHSQLHLLLPEVCMVQELVASGRMADVARKCNVRIELGTDVIQAQRHVILTGT